MSQVDINVEKDHLNSCLFPMYVPSHSVMSNCAAPWNIAHQAPLSMDSPGKITGVVCHFLLQEIFPTQGSNLCLFY